MSDVNTGNNAEKRSIANMEGLQSAIVNGEADRVKQLLANQTLDELQKNYLVDLADMNGKPEIVKLVKEAPSRP